MMTYKQICVKYNLEQLSHSMSVLKISRYARIQEKTCSLATAKLVIFATDIVWGNCSKYNFSYNLHHLYTVYC